MIPALVLTAGLATRLRPLSRVRAKAALPVAGQPLVHRILRWLAASGVTDCVLNLHHLPHTITGLVGDGSSLDVRVRYSWEMPVLGSAGGPRRALPLLASSRFLIVNGDTLTNVDVASAIEHHRATGALVTMALVPNTEPDKYGGVLVDSRGIVTGFCRKGSARPSYHFIGLQVAEADAFAGLPDNTPHETVNALYPQLIQERPESVQAYISQSEFLDIGTPADYLRTSLTLAGVEAQPQSLVGERTRLEAGVSATDSVLWDDVIVERGARLRRCIVTDGVRVPAGTEWESVTLRHAWGELEPGETRHDDLAVTPIA
jgi:NDP-sugar pyrophosphorylase family protein